EPHRLRCEHATSHRDGIAFHISQPLHNRSCKYYHGFPVIAHPKYPIPDLFEFLLKRAKAFSKLKISYRVKSYKAFHRCCSGIRVDSGIWYLNSLEIDFCKISVS